LEEENLRLRKVAHVEFGFSTWLPKDDMCKFLDTVWITNRYHYPRSID
jgi:hypothetical protein